MRKHLLAAFILLAYCALLFKIMVLKDVPMVRVGSMMFSFGGSQTGPPNLIPFKTIFVYLLGEKGWLIGFINLVGNIVLLMPVGLLLPIVLGYKSWKKILPFAVAAGFLIEGTQVILRLGIFDIDDVILNGLGVMTGYWIFMALARNVHSVKARNLIIVIVVSVVVSTAAAVYGFGLYQGGSMPVRFDERPEQGTVGNGSAVKGADPCGGTGGLGKIVVIKNHFITITRSDGVNEVVKLNAETKIKSAAGVIVESDLKLGDRATIVTMESDEAGNKIAAAVLICAERF
ncbi:MAG: VanZ family protein [Bacteroidota bacterium]